MREFQIFQKSGITRKTPQSYTIQADSINFYDGWIILQTGDLIKKQVGAFRAENVEKIISSEVTIDAEQDESGVEV